MDFAIVVTKGIRGVGCLGKYLVHKEDAKMENDSESKVINK